MPLKKIDYTQAVVYKIQHIDNDELLYIGSTTNYVARKSVHKTMCNNNTCKNYNSLVYKMIRENGGWKNFNMVVIPTEPCNTKQDLLTLEDKVMREMKSSMNTRKAHNTCDDIKYYRKEYYAENKDQIKENNCKYYQANINKIKESKSKYYQENKERINNNCKQYYKTNIDKINLQKNTKVTCECGSISTLNNIHTHRKSQKCIDYYKYKHLI